MSKTPKPTDAELAILRVLWVGASTVRQVHEVVADGRPLAYTTTLKLLQIMTEKGLVRRQELGRGHLYQARYAEEETQRRLVGDLLDRAFGGSAAKLVLQALAATRATAEERRQIRDLLEKASVSAIDIVTQTPLANAIGWALLVHLAGSARRRADGRRASRPSSRCRRRALRGELPRPGPDDHSPGRDGDRESRGVERPPRAGHGRDGGRVIVDPDCSDGVRGRADFGADEPAVLRAGDRRFVEHRRRTWLPAAVLIWIAGVTLLSARLAAGWLIVERLRRRSTRAVSAPLAARVAKMARQLRVTRPVRALESAIVDVPTVVGWLRPVILLPASALAGLSPAQLEAVIAHELAHVRRHDLVNLLQTVVETLLFYHPAVWWLSHRIRIERENCCMTIAVELCGDRVAYAHARWPISRSSAAQGRPLPWRSPVDRFCRGCAVFSACPRRTIVDPPPGLR